MLQDQLQIFLGLQRSASGRLSDASVVNVQSERLDHSAVAFQDLNHSDLIAVFIF